MPQVITVQAKLVVNMVLKKTKKRRISDGYPEEAIVTAIGKNNTLVVDAVDNDQEFMIDHEYLQQNYAMNGYVDGIS